MYVHLYRIALMAVFVVGFMEILGQRKMKCTVIISAYNFGRKIIIISWSWYWDKNRELKSKFFGKMFLNLF